MSGLRWYGCQEQSNRKRWEVNMCTPCLAVDDCSITRRWRPWKFTQSSKILQLGVVKAWSIYWCRTRSHMKMVPPRWHEEQFPSHVAICDSSLNLSGHAYLMCFFPNKYSSGNVCTRICGSTDLIHAAVQDLSRVPASFTWGLPTMLEASKCTCRQQRANNAVWLQPMPERGIRSA